VVPNNLEASPSEGYCDPVVHWIQHNTWPQIFAERNIGMSSSKKRRIAPSTKDTTQSVTRTNENDMKESGMIMDILQTDVIPSNDSTKLCETLLAGKCKTPEDSLFHEDCFSTAIGAANRNEARVVRDIMPLVVPSAELLSIRNIVTKLEHVIEELDTQWVCNVICGRCPKPDFAAGLASSAFTPEEVKWVKSIPCTSYVTKSMCFPFLVCEVKSADGSIYEAEKQAMHAASIAVRAVIELYREVSREHELDKEILVFSIVHNHRIGFIYGHYARVDKKLRYFRRLISSFDLMEDMGKNRWKAYNFTRKVYADFFPKHLERIRSALSKLEKRPPESGYEVSGHNDVEAPKSKPSLMSLSQDNVFREPTLTGSATLRKEIFQREQIKPLQEKIEDLLQQHEKQQQQLQQQLEQQRLQYQEQLSKLLEKMEH
jgi:hypothetical protein